MVSSVKQADRSLALDGIRALAALGVVVYHCSNGSGFLLRIERSAPISAAILANLGNFCVCVFFLLSGFLLFRDFARTILFDQRTPTLPEYFERRFLRIYPAYWVALIGFTLVVGSQNVNGGVFGLLTLTERHVNTTSIFPGIPAAWTLAIEVAFYLFLPIFSLGLILLSRRRSQRVRTIITFISLGALMTTAHLWIGVVLAANRSDLRLQMNLPTYLGWFALGMLLIVLQLLRESGRQIPAALQELAEHPWWCWAGTVVVYCGAASMHLIQFENGSARESILQFQARIGLQGVAAFLLLLPLVLGTRPSRFHSMISARRLAWVGVVSYGVYLWHQAVIRETIKHTNFSSDLFGYVQLMAIVLPVSILIGWISFKFLERPMLSLARRSRKADQ